MKYKADLLITAIRASIKAGHQTLPYYNRNTGVVFKEDNSPLTNADIASNLTITDELKFTQVPILSEEGKKIPYSERKNWKLFWLIDPLDGTKEFIKKNGEFTINIALIDAGIPVMGIVYVPVLKDIYFSSFDVGSYKAKGIQEDFANYDLETIIAKSKKLPLLNNDQSYKIVGSRSHMNQMTMDYFDQLKKKHQNVEIIAKGSSLKICLVAEGKAQEYPRFGPTMEWDTAAGHCIAKYAGKSMINPATGEELTYNKEDLLNPYFIVK